MRMATMYGPPGMGPNAIFCTIEAMSNGMVVRYQEAERRRRKVRSPLAGLDMSYFATLAEMISMQTGGGEDWEEDKKKERMEKIKEILKSSKLPTEDKFADEWVTVERSIFCPKMEDVPAAIKTAHEAYLGILSIQKDGDSVFPDSPFGVAQAI